MTRRVASSIRIEILDMVMVMNGKTSGDSHDTETKHLIHSDGCLSIIAIIILTRVFPSGGLYGSLWD